MDVASGRVTDSPPLHDAQHDSSTPDSATLGAYVAGLESALDAAREELSDAESLINVLKRRISTLEKANAAPPDAAKHSPPVTPILSSPLLSIA